MHRALCHCAVHALLRLLLLLLLLFQKATTNSNCSCLSQTPTRMGLKKRKASVGSFSRFGGTWLLICRLRHMFAKRQSCAVKYLASTRIASTRRCKKRSFFIFSASSSQTRPVLRAKHVVGCKTQASWVSETQTSWALSFFSRIQPRGQ